MDTMNPTAPTPRTTIRLRGAALAACLGLLHVSGAHAEPSDWASHRGGQGLPGVAAGSLTDELVLLWTFEAGGAIASSPVVADGRVYFGSDDGKLYAVDFETGAKVWEFATEDIVEAPPLYHDGTVFVGSSDYFVYAIDAETGALRWKRETDDKILGAANWVPGPDGEGFRIVVGSYDTNLYCFDGATGETIWTYSTENYVNGTPAILGDLIVFGGCDAILHVVSATTGEAATTLELGADCHVAGSVALADGKVYFGHYGNAFICVDMAANRIDWSYPSERHPFFSSPAIGADRIVFGGRDKRLHCVDRATGEPIWTFPTRRKVDGSPVICADKVVFGSADGRVYVVSLADGSELWSYEIGKSIFCSPAVTDGRILIGANDGLMYAFGPKAEGGTEER